MNHEELVVRIIAKLRNVQPYCLSGRRISFSSDETREDAQVILESLVVWSGMLLDFSESSSTFMLKNCAQRGRFIKLIEPAVLSVATSPLENSLSFLDNLTHLILNEMSQFPGVFKGHTSLNKATKKLIETSDVPKELGELFAVAIGSFSVLEDVARGDHAPIFRYLLSITRFLKKLPISRNDLEEFMVAEYLDDELRLGEVEAHLKSDSAKWWLYSLNTLAKQVFSDFDMSKFCPQHGPGRVAKDGIRSTFDKFFDMKDDRRVSYLLGKHGLGTLADYTPWELTSHSERTATFICVPKTWKSLRGISAEPTELQFSQQAVLFALDCYFRATPFFQRRFDLHSQDQNRILCQKGSHDQSFATIDLSKASDSVSLQLVKEVFKGTKLLPWLLATRSHSVSLPGHLPLRIKKFAPMGSSVCFPVECIIFTLIAEVARRTCERAGKETISLPLPRIFGDDIVCASASVPLVLDGLSQLGFLPNKEKSYWTGFYRESCGKEYWHGKDVSPIYYRVEGGQLFSHFTTYDGVTSLVSLYNSLYLNGYNTARRIVLASLLRKTIAIGEKTFRFSDLCVRSFDGERGTIVSSMPTNFQIRKSVNKSYQRLTYRQLAWKPVYVEIEKLLYESDDAQAVLYCLWSLEALRKDSERQMSAPMGVGMYARLPIGFAMVPRIKGSAADGFDTIRC